MSIPPRVSSATPPPSGRKADINVAPRDVAGLLRQLREYHRTFSPLFFRKEQRHWSLKYLEGQMLDIERKAIEPMARALAGGEVQAMQQFISVGAWKDEPLILKHQALVAQSLGAPDGVVILDGATFPSKGRIRWAWPGSGVGRWAKSPIARRVWCWCMPGPRGSR